MNVQKNNNSPSLWSLLSTLSKIFISNPMFKRLMAMTLFIVPLYLFMFYFDILPEYLYILEFILTRLVLIFLLLMVLQILLNLPIAKDFQKELQIFNKDPKDKPFIVLLRRYHFQLFLLSYISFSLATTYFVENFMLSYVLGIIAFISVILYLVQFVVYTKNYLQQQNKNFTYTGKRYISTDSIRKAGVICLECAKVGVQLGLGAEAGWKLTHGGMNDISPWRQSALNHMFPDDRTKIWTETKAGMAMHNRAMGYPHDNIYKPKEILDDIRNSASNLPKGKK